MIAAAALLVLVALVLFVWGIAAGATALYWACVAVSAVAAVLLVVARLRMRRQAADPAATRGDDPGHAPAYPAGGPGSSVPDTGDGAPLGALLPPSAGSAAPAAGPTGAPTPPSAGGDDDPPVEEVEVTDLLLVVDLRDDVHVVDEHPRYHLAGCSWLAGRSTVPLPLHEARADGFTPCGVCAPDHGLAEVERGRRASRGAL